MKGLSFNALRTGKRYRLKNLGEQYDFEILDILASGDFVVKDLHTLETFRLKQTIQFGVGKDFEIRELR